MTTEALSLGDSFGRGGGDPYDHALRTSGSLVLHDVGPMGRDGGASAREVHVRRFLGRADRAERRVLASTRGSVLDIGCGPARMVAEALRAGRAALGVDVSPAAAELAAERGLPVHRGSVFDPVPGSGLWDVVLLVDGNVGIGGRPAHLLRRCAELASPAGRLVVETASDRRRSHEFTAVVSTPGLGASGRFPWAEVGAEALADVAALAGWEPAREVRNRHRTFVVLRRVDPR